MAVYEDDGDGVYEPTTDDTLIDEYEFDGFNRRIEKVLSSTHAHYYYNNDWQLLEERFVDGQGATLSTNQHVFSARYIDSPIVWLHDGNGDGDLLDVGDLIRYYLSDANHNTTAVFDSVTGLENRYVYDAYGSHKVYDSDWDNPDDPTADGFMYCGYWRDAETGNYQVRAREYITSLSTFDVRDPIGYSAGDANLYRYVGNNPLTHTDPLGTLVVLPPPAVAANPIVAGCAFSVMIASAVGEHVVGPTTGVIVYWWLEDTDVEKPNWDVKARQCIETRNRYKDAEDKGKNFRDENDKDKLREKCEAWDDVVKDRELYLIEKCDWFLKGSIDKGSEKAERGHKEALEHAKEAAKNCWERLKKLFPGK